MIQCKTLATYDEQHKAQLLFKDNRRSSAFLFLVRRHTIDTENDQRVDSIIRTSYTRPLLALPPAAQTAKPSPFGMGLKYLLLSVHRPGGGQMSSFCPFRWWRRWPSFTGDRVHDINAAILICEPDS